MQVEIVGLKLKPDESTQQKQRSMNRVRTERVRHMKEKDNMLYPTWTKTDSGYMSKNRI